jgi:UDP-N-acetylmuramoyl-tripeptide--D-alanyl-D-alanine ligase
LSDTVVGAAILSPENASGYAGGRVAHRGSVDIQGVVVDSRHVEENYLFVALPGQRVDGHDFIPQALERGASAIMCSTAYWSKRRGQLERILQTRRDASVIEVGDTLAGLQKMAKAYLRRFPEILRIGVTGSNGKTTTKEILGSIIATDRPTVISEGNLNSEIGLPLSCFRTTSAHRAAVFEMGINHPGEMDILADIYRPDIGVITNIGTAHIGLLGSREAIAREKRKIFSYFNGTQKAFISESEEYEELLKQGLRGKISYYGPTKTRGFEGSEDLGLGGAIIHWEGLQIRFPLFGAHNLENALASISVSTELGISKEKIKEGLENIPPLFGRSQIRRGPVTIIQDFYNANPDSFAQVFAFIAALPWSGRKIGVLGAMGELGAHSEQAHRRIGVLASRSGFQGLFLFGQQMEAAYSEIRDRNYRGMVEWMTDIESLRESLHTYLRDGDLLLIKGSRAAELERLMSESSEG